MSRYLAAIAVGCGVTSFGIALLSALHASGDHAVWAGAALGIAAHQFTLAVSKKRVE